MANQQGGGSNDAYALGPQPRQYIFVGAGPARQMQLNPAWVTWNQQQQRVRQQQQSDANFAANEPSYAASGKGPQGVAPSGGLPGGNTVIGNDGKKYIVDNNGVPIGLAPGQTPTGPGNTQTPYPLGGGGSSAPTWYEQQQVALDKQRLADAEAQQAAAQKATEATAVENFNKDFRDFQSKSFYGSQYGPTYFSPAGSVFAQRAPESSTLKQAFADSGQPDPWAQTGNVPAGYTGTTYSNPQHPGLTDFGQPSVQQGVQPPVSPAPQAQPNQQQFMQWHDLAHQIAQPQSAQPAQPPTQPVNLGGQVAQLPSFDNGGTVPGDTGSPQLIVAHGGEQVVPNQAPDGMGGGDWLSNFSAWHDQMHSMGGPSGMPVYPGDQATPQSSQTTNAYGQQVNSNVVHGLGEDVTAAPLGYSPESKQYLSNHVQYGPELNGLSGLGGLISPNGTPVVMSNWQRQQFDPTSIANYGDYAHSIAGWNPADLAQYSTNITGNVGDLSRPTSWAPIGIQPSASGG